MSFLLGKLSFLRAGEAVLSVLADRRLFPRLGLEYPPQTEGDLRTLEICPSRLSGPHSRKDSGTRLSGRLWVGGMPAPLTLTWEPGGCLGPYLLITTVGSSSPLLQGEGEGGLGMVEVVLQVEPLPQGFPEVFFHSGVCHCLLQPP